RPADKRKWGVRRDRAVMAAQTQAVGVPQEYEDVRDATQARSALRDGVEHWLHVGRRARYDFQDLARGCLLVERFGEVRVVGLQRGQEAGVLDRDHRLVGEAAQKG